ncbi:MAG: hypothetical protein J6J56_05185 [Rikenellaceae bacterium]|nr:hypothetical protein [Rikenellaceae bacterium]
MKKYLLFALGCILFTSCGSEKIPEIKDVKTNETAVICQQGEFISVVPNTYQLKCKDRVYIKVNLELKQNSSWEVGYNKPELVLLDEDGRQIIDGSWQMSLSDTDQSKFESFLKNGEVGTTKEFIFENNFGYDSYAMKAMTQTENFTISLYLEEPEEEKISENNAMESLLDIADEITEEVNDDDFEDIEKTIDAVKETTEIMKSLIDIL